LPGKVIGINKHKLSPRLKRSLPDADKDMSNEDSSLEFVFAHFYEGSILLSQTSLSALPVVATRRHRPPPPPPPPYENAYIKALHFPVISVAPQCSQNGRGRRHSQFVSKYSPHLSNTY